MNLFHRASHVISPSAGIDSMIGMGFHIMFNTLKKAWRDFDADHIVFCLEGRKNWRKEFYKPYKLTRKLAKLERSVTQQETDDIMMEAFNDFCDFMKERTNVSVLQNQLMEADDLIAFFIQSHPDDHHVICSSDSDYQQLVCDNVSIYNGVEKVLITPDGFFDDKNKPVLDKKTKLPKLLGDPDYLLFFKCIRGDKSDNVFSAYPGVREKGTKNKVGILDAFADRHTKGYNWNNFMNQRWTDEDGEEHTVLDDYERNHKLICLSAQPEEVKVAGYTTVLEAADQEIKDGVGFHFMKFCGRWDLVKIGEFPDVYAKMLHARYK